MKFKHNIGIRVRIQWSTEYFRWVPCLCLHRALSHFHWAGFSVWLEWWNWPMPTSYTTPMAKGVAT